MVMMMPLFLTDLSKEEKDELESYLQKTLEVRKQELEVAREQHKFFAEMAKSTRFVEGIFEVFNNLKDAVLFIDNKEHLRWMNSAAEELLNRKKTDVVDKDCHALFETNEICSMCSSLVEEAIVKRKTRLNPCWTSPTTGKQYSILAVPFFNGITGCIGIITTLDNPTQESSCCS